MIPLDAIAKLAGLLVLLITATVGAVTYFESAAGAKAEHEQIAANEETARLRTQLELLDLKLQRYKDIAKVRPLTEEEQIDLRAIEAERAVVLARMAAKA